MSSFFLLDTAGDQQLFDENATQGTSALYNSATNDRLLTSDHNEESEDDEPVELELFGVKLNNKAVSEVVEACNPLATAKPPTKVLMQLDELTEKVNEAVQNASTHTFERQRIVESGVVEGLQIRKENVETDMKKTRRVPGFEQLKALPTVGRRKQPLLNRAEREKTKGSGWFDLPATEVTDEMRNELKIIQMRSVLDPKHFYKKNDLKVLPKYFQVGTVQHSALDHYSDKHSRKTKKSLVDELLEDEAFQKFNKRKYKEVIQRTDKYAHRKAMKKMKKLKKHK
ncbi:hypothetical protein KR222_008738 [Zaprionus bogoriensis]|nr:hypothetical protein KR222_008738 [Zaprionus bogoriensis]